MNSIEFSSTTANNQPDQQASGICKFSPEAWARPAHGRVATLSFQRRVLLALETGGRTTGYHGESKV